MQDRFRFRAWQMRYWGEQMPDKPSGLMNYFSISENLKNKDIDFKKDPIMQCTGLKDKNGKLIYEGDIVKYHCPSDYCADGYHQCKPCCDGELAEIVFDNDCACFKYSNAKDSCTLDDNIDTENDLEIIGNIYENKELLND